MWPFEQCFYVIERLSVTAFGTRCKLGIISDYCLFLVYFYQERVPCIQYARNCCGPLLRGPQRGVFCILPAVPSFLGSSICIVLRPFRYSHYHDSTEQNIAFHRDQPQDSSPGSVRWHFRPRIYHRSCHHSSEAGP